MGAGESGGRRVVSEEALLEEDEEEEATLEAANARSRSYYKLS